MSNPVILAGDVGGTKVNLAVFSMETRAVSLTPVATFPSRQHANLEEIARKFLATTEVRPDFACFGVAGPVAEGRARLTNLPWLIDSSQLTRELGLKQAWVINDLEAYAYGIGGLSSEDFAVLNAGDPNARGNAAVIAAGTGLGEAGLYWDGHQFHPFACEGGHADFSPRSDLDLEFSRYARAEVGQVEWEHALSGPGLYRIYRFLRDTGRGEEPAWLAEEFRRNDPPAVVTRMALENKNPLCVQALELFVTYYGMEARNLALKIMARGGVYVGGGIAPKIISKLKDGCFTRAFIGEGPLKPLLEKMPVRVILNDQTALIGAARYAALQTGQSC